MNRKHFLRLLIAGIAIALLLAPIYTPPAAAAPPGPPAPGLNPPPAPDARCQTNNQGTICRAVVGPIVESFNSGLTCNGNPIIHSVSWNLHGTAYYNQAQQATRVVVHFDYPNGPANTLSNPATGGSVRFEAHYTNKIDFAVPGDLSTFTETYVGQVFKSTVPGLGAVLRDVGKVVFTPDGISFEAGPHQILQGDLTALCAALAVP